MHGEPAARARRDERMLGFARERITPTMGGKVTVDGG